MDVAKRKGWMALYKVAEVISMRKKLSDIRTRVDRAVNRMKDLEKSVKEYRGQQGKSRQTVTQEVQKSR